MDTHLWTVSGIFLIYFLFAVAESAASLLNKHKVQVILDSIRERSALSRKLLPVNASYLRSLLTTGKLLSIVAITISLTLTKTNLTVIIFTFLAILILLLALYLPALLAYRNPKAALTILLPLIKFANILLMPLTMFSNFIFVKFRSKVRRMSAEQEEEEDAQQIEAYLDEAEEQGLFEPAEVEMVRQVIEFGDTVVKGVMTPRVNMECIDKTASLVKFSEIANELKFSRYPVIDEKIDNVVGIVLVKSLLSYIHLKNNQTNVAEIMASPYFVPESKKVSILLRDFQNNKQQMAIVVDEYGGTAGLITLEDILEEIVGEIEDEHDATEETAEIIQLADGSLIVPGNADVTEVEKIMKVELDDKSYETVSGLALTTLKRIPKVGEEFVVHGIKIEIIDADEKSINKLKMTKTEKNE